jgi:hypothetical protein
MWILNASVYWLNKEEIDENCKIVNAESRMPNGVVK